MTRAYSFLVGVGALCAISALAIPEPYAGDPHWANSDCTPSPRPLLNVTEAIKRQMIASQYPGHPMSEFELDHIGPLCLGGLPNSPTNFQLQRWPEADAKDALERGTCRAVHMHHLSCTDGRAIILQWNERNHKP